MGLPAKKKSDTKDPKKEEVDGAIKKFGEKNKNMSPSTRKKVAEKLKAMKEKKK